MYDVLILGGGPAGLTAALYAKRAGISVLVLEKTIYGGQVVNTPMVENYPGIQTIAGADLAMALYDQVTSLGVEIRLEEPVSVQLDTNPKAIATARGLYEGKTVIIANGVKRRKLGCPGEEKFSGRGSPTAPPATGPSSGGRWPPLWGEGTPPWRTPFSWRTTAPPSISSTGGSSSGAARFWRRR